MEIRRVSLALSFAGMAGAGIVGAAEGPQDKAPVQQPHGIFRGVSTAVKFDISPPLRSMQPAADPLQKIGDTQRNSGMEGPLGPQTPDTVIQTRIGPGEIPAPNLSFDGFDGTGPNPPDPVGDVGPNHYVAMANLRFAIYSKAGALLFGPVNNNTLWAGFGGDCQTDNSGDPIVLHDQLADRWILTQFTASGPTFFNCVAVSTTPDPTGTYFRWAFSNGTDFPDYPKYGVWPEALFISTRDFAGGGPFVGLSVFAINRAQLVAGNPAPQVIEFFVNAATAGGMFNIGDGLLPSDLDGSTLPPPGTPNFFIGSRDQGGPYGAPNDSLTLWRYIADFTNPPASSFTLVTTLPVSTFDSIMPAPCSTTRECIPQPPPTGATQRLDHLGYRQRPLHRAAYRNFGTHEAIVTNQSVEAPANMSGVRWYEIRNPNTAPAIFQDGTYSPGATDGIFRWMGSIAQDRAGNMALGFSVSDGVSTFPGIRYTGRLVTDPLGEMPQGEGVMVDGIGAQLTTNNRWGDYTSMNVDPTTDCTFWYINEYYPVSSGTIWRLRIGQFAYPVPQCIPVPVELQSFHIE